MNTLGFGKFSDPEYGCTPEKEGVKMEDKQEDFKVIDRRGKETQVKRPEPPKPSSNVVDVTMACPNCRKKQMFSKFIKARDTGLLVCVNCGVCFMPKSLIAKVVKQLRDRGEYK